jgi:soluble lytic murein transglycosylase-like protein
MRQESIFARANQRRRARTASLTIDSAQKYAARAGYPNLQEDDLYNPTIAIAAANTLQTSRANFPINQKQSSLPTTAAKTTPHAGSSARQNDPGVFASEVGFAETKDYVFKVMSNYRAYKSFTQSLSVRDNRALRRTISPHSFPRTLFQYSLALSFFRGG